MIVMNKNTTTMSVSVSLQPVYLDHYMYPHTLIVWASLPSCLHSIYLIQPFRSIIYFDSIRIVWARTSIQLNLFEGALTLTLTLWANSNNAPSKSINNLIIWWPRTASYCPPLAFIPSSFEQWSFMRWVIRPPTGHRTRVYNGTSTSPRGTDRSEPICLLHLETEQSPERPICTNSTIVYV